MLSYDLVPKGLDEPCSCKTTKWTTAKKEVIKPAKKWILKNLVKVGLLTVNPPQIHSTSLSPINGTEEKKFVITVAAHKLIWPQTKTYPEKAVNIIITKIKHPDNHKLTRVKLLQYKAFPICIYINKNINEATFTCVYLINHPNWTFLIMLSTLTNAKLASLL